MIFSYDSRATKSENRDTKLLKRSHLNVRRTDEAQVSCLLDAYLRFNLLALVLRVFFSLRLGNILLSKAPICYAIFLCCNNWP